MNLRTFVAALAATFAISIAGALADTTTTAPGIELTASNWKFTPGMIVAHPGETIVLHAKSTEGMHALISDDLGIKPVMLPPGKTVDITFVAPTKPGKYYMRCHLPCGPGHDKMTIVVDVQA
jgi:heme/copper-type cytochrome/quinol oxidase subunit 2